MPKRNQFALDLGKFTKNMEQDRIPGLVRQVVQEGALIMKQDAPVRTGFLRATIQISINALTGTTIEIPESVKRRGAQGERAFFEDRLTETGIALAGIKLGDVAYVEVGANYAPYVERARPFVSPVVPKLAARLPAIAKKLNG